MCRLYDWLIDSLFFRKLRQEQLDQLLSQLHGFLLAVPNDVRDAEEEIISRVDAALSVRADNAKAIAEPLAGWLVDYFQYVLLGFPCNSQSLMAHDAQRATCLAGGLALVGHLVHRVDTFPG